MFQKIFFFPVFFFKESSLNHKNSFQGDSFIIQTYIFNSNNSLNEIISGSSAILHSSYAFKINKAYTFSMPLFCDFEASSNRSSLKMMGLRFLPSW